MADGALSLMNMQDNHDDELEAMGHEVTQTEFVKSFIGPPCTVEGCIAIVKELRQKRLRKQEVEVRSLGFCTCNSICATHDVCVWWG